MGKTMRSPLGPLDAQENSQDLKTIIENVLDARLDKYQCGLENVRKQLEEDRQRTDQKTDRILHALLSGTKAVWQLPGFRAAHEAAVRRRRQQGRQSVRLQWQLDRCIIGHDVWAADCVPPASTAQAGAA
eukprot:gene1182-1519_t